MMYGFGDDQNPYTESVDFLEDIVIEFITEVVSSAAFDFVHNCFEVMAKFGNEISLVSRRTCYFLCGVRQH